MKHILIALDQAEVLICRVLGIIHIALGAAVFVGGAIRFPPPTYTPLLGLLDNQVWPYGVLWSSAGLFMLLSRSRWKQMVGLFISILITNLWAALFAVAAYQFPTAGLTASVAYGGYGLLSGVLLGFMLVHSGRDWLEERGGRWTLRSSSEYSPSEEP